jgi:undecaprenyl diphosphate synthase
MHLNPPEMEDFYCPDFLKKRVGNSVTLPTISLLFLYSCMEHIGFIMDGNRRWAKKLKNLISFWHLRGGENIEKVLGMCLAKNISYVSMWALSKENITERDSEEVAAIYELIRTKVPKLVTSMKEKSIKFETIGDLWLLPDDVRNLLFEATESTKEGTAMTFILAFAYGGQDEIVRGVKRCILEGIDPSTLDDKTFLQYLDSGAFPPPNLIVRTGGNIRHSGYFLYQSAYSEYYFTETLWPDFDQAEFDRAVSYYEKVQRNFGK